MADSERSDKVDSITVEKCLEWMRFGCPFLAVGVGEHDVADFERRMLKAADVLEKALRQNERSGDSDAKTLDAQWCMDAFWRVNPGRNATVPSLYLLDFAREVLRVFGSPPSATKDHEELLEIHRAVMNPEAVVIGDADTLTVRRVKEFVQRAFAQPEAAPSVSAPPGVTVTVSYDAPQWIEAKVLRVEGQHGIAYVEATGAQFVATFDRIDGYGGQPAKEIGLLEGRTVHIMIRDGTVARLSLNGVPSHTQSPQRYETKEKP